MPKFISKKKILKKSTPSPFLIPQRTLPTDILLHKIQNERSTRIMEKDNTLTFKCKNSATKTEIKKAFLELYETEIVKVNTVNSPKGFKKAYVRLREAGAAIRLANEAGMI